MAGMRDDYFFTYTFSFKSSLDKIYCNSYSNSAHFLISLNKTYLMSS